MSHSDGLSRGYHPAGLDAEVVGSEPCVFLEFWGLMIVLFALGVMSLLWMAVVATLIFAQKLLPRGEYLTRVFAVGFIAAGIWVASAPGSVPGLTQPNSDAADRARMMHMTPDTEMEPEGKVKPATEMNEMQLDGQMEP